MNGNCLAGSGKRDVYLQIKDDDFSVNIAGELALSPKASVSLSALAYPDYKNITAKPNALNPNTQVDVAWDELRIEGIRTALKSFTLDITSSGALGLDTGSEAVSTWYYIWAICNDAGTTVSAILSASATSPTLPSGYTKKRLISAVYNLATGHFRAFEQRNSNYVFAMITALSSGTSGSWVQIDLSTIIPAAASLCYGSISNGAAGYTTHISSNSNGHGDQTTASSGGTCNAPYAIPVFDRKLYYSVNGGSGNLYVSGYELDL